MQRARFPDITANTLRGLVGVSTKRDPQYELPSNIAYMEDVATVDGMSLNELYAFCISEILQVGRLALVVDFRQDGTVYIAPYTTESYINWELDVIDMRRVQTMAAFEHMLPSDDRQDRRTMTLVYALEEGRVNTYKFVDDQLVEGPTPITNKGRIMDSVPVVNVGSVRNEPWPGVVPLIGVSDCALDIYRHSADLSNAHFNTCNPTLVISGVEAQEMPRTVGSTVSMALSNPQAKAYYPSTDTSALSHINAYQQQVLQEAVGYGAQLLGPTKRAAESAEALSLRQAASGATLVGVVEHVGDALREALQLASDMTGGGEVEFEPNKEFAELTLSAQDVTALVSSWMNGAISHESLLENFIEAGIVSADKAPDDEIDLINMERPAMETPEEQADDTPEENADDEVEGEDDENG
jgi:hypothetical protein